MTSPSFGSSLHFPVGGTQRPSGWRYLDFFPPFWADLRPEAGSHRADTLTMLIPAELAVVWMLGGCDLRCNGPWRPSPSEDKAGGDGRLMMAVVMRPLLLLILLLSSGFTFRFERLWKKKRRERKQVKQVCCWQSEAATSCLNNG